MSDVPLVEAATNSNGPGRKRKDRIQAQENKCLNEKRRREQENVYMEELAELISASISDMANCSTVKPDKCAILQETVNKIRNIQKQEGSGSSDAVQQSQVSSSKPGLLNSDVIIGPLLLEALDGFLFVVNSQGLIDDVSENVTQYIKYTQEDLLGKSIYSIVHVTDHSHFSASGGANFLMPGGIPWLPGENQGSRSRSFECRLLIKPAESSDSMDMKPVQLLQYVTMQILAIVQPITRDKETDLPDQENQSCLVCIARHVGFAEKTAAMLGVEQFTTKQDLDGKILDYDTSVISQRFYQYPNFIGLNIKEFCHVNDCAQLCRHHQEVIKNGSNTSSVYRFKLHDSRYVFVQTKSKLFKHPTSLKLEFIMSTHSIVRDCDTDTELKGSASTSLMKSLISQSGTKTRDIHAIVGQSSAGGASASNSSPSTSALAPSAKSQTLTRFLGESKLDIQADGLQLNDILDLLPNSSSWTESGTSQRVAQSSVSSSPPVAHPSWSVDGMSAPASVPPRSMRSRSSTKPLTSPSAPNHMSHRSPGYSTQRSPSFSPSSASSFTSPGLPNVPPSPGVSSNITTQVKGTSSPRPYLTSSNLPMSDEELNLIQSVFGDQFLESSAPRARSRSNSRKDSTSRSSSSNLPPQAYSPRQGQSPDAQSLVKRLLDLKCQGRQQNPDQGLPVNFMPKIQEMLMQSKSPTSTATLRDLLLNGDEEAPTGRSSPQLPQSTTDQPDSSSKAPLSSSKAQPPPNTILIQLLNKEDQSEGDDEAAKASPERNEAEPKKEDSNMLLKKLLKDTDFDPESGKGVSFSPGKSGKGKTNPQLLNKLLREKESSVEETDFSEERAVARRRGSMSTHETKESVQQAESTSHDQKDVWSGRQSSSPGIHKCSDLPPPKNTPSSGKNLDAVLNNMWESGDNSLASPATLRGTKRKSSVLADSTEEEASCQASGCQPKPSKNNHLLAKLLSVKAHQETVVNTQNINASALPQSCLPSNKSITSRMLNAGASKQDEVEGWDSTRSNPESPFPTNSEPQKKSVVVLDTGLTGLEAPVNQSSQPTTRPITAVQTETPMDSSGIDPEVAQFIQEHSGYQPPALQTSSQPPTDEVSILRQLDQVFPGNPSLLDIFDLNPPSGGSDRGLDANDKMKIDAIQQQLMSVEPSVVKAVASSQGNTRSPMPGMPSSALCNLQASLGDPNSSLSLPGMAPALSRDLQQLQHQLQHPQLQQQQQQQHQQQQQQQQQHQQQQQYLQQTLNFTGAFSQTEPPSRLPPYSVTRALGRSPSIPSNNMMSASSVEHANTAALSNVMGTSGGQGSSVGTNNLLASIGKSSSVRHNSGLGRSLGTMNRNSSSALSNNGLVSSVNTGSVPVSSVSSSVGLTSPLGPGVGQRNSLGSGSGLSISGAQSGTGFDKILGVSFDKSLGVIFDKPSGPNAVQSSSAGLGPSTDASIHSSSATISLSSGASIGQTSGSSIGQTSGASIGQPQVSNLSQLQGSSLGQSQGSSLGQSQGSSLGQSQGSSLGQPQLSDLGRSQGVSLGQLKSLSMGNCPPNVAVPHTIELQERLKQRPDLLKSRQQQTRQRAVNTQRPSFSPFTPQNSAQQEARMQSSALPENFTEIMDANYPPNKSISRSQGAPSPISPHQSPQALPSLVPPMARPPRHSPYAASSGQMSPVSPQPRGLQWMPHSAGSSVNQSGKLTRPVPGSLPASMKTGVLPGSSPHDTVHSQDSAKFHFNDAQFGGGGSNQALHSPAHLLSPREVQASPGHTPSQQARLIRQHSLHSGLTSPRGSGTSHSPFGQDSHLLSPHAGSQSQKLSPPNRQLTPPYSQQPQQLNMSGMAFSQNSAMSGSHSTNFPQHSQAPSGFTQATVTQDRKAEINSQSVKAGLRAMCSARSQHHTSSSHEAPHNQDSFSDFFSGGGELPPEVLESITEMANEQAAKQAAAQHNKHQMGGPPPQPSSSLASPTYTSGGESSYTQVRQQSKVIYEKLQQLSTCGPGKTETSPTINPQTRATNVFLNQLSLPPDINQQVAHNKPTKPSSSAVNVVQTEPRMPVEDMKPNDHRNSLLQKLLSDNS